MNRHRLILLLVVLIGAALAAGLAWKSGVFRPAPPPSAIGGPFELVDQNGQAVDQDVLKGKWSAVFFGFTYCPDLCPTTLHALDAADGLLGERAKDLRVVFISVDPDRDTPKQMKDYLGAQGFKVETLGLTGSAAQVAGAAKAYRVFYQKVGTGPDYDMQHTGIVYLMDPKGRFVAPLSPTMSPAQMAEQIEKAMAG